MIQTTIRKVRRFYVWSIISFFGLVGICIALKPNAISYNGGVSYFGNYRLTLLPYIGALVLSGWFIYQIALNLPDQKPYPEPIKHLLGTLPVLLVFLVLLPSHGPQVVSMIHRFIGSAIFIIEGLLTLYWLRYKIKDRIRIAALIVMLFSGIASAIYMVSSSGYSLVSQLTFQFGFSLALGRQLFQDYGD